MSLLYEIHGSLESALERQASLMNRSDEKSALLVRLGVLTLVGALGLVTFVVQAAGDALGWRLAVVLVLGAAMNLGGILVLLLSYLGGSRGGTIAVAPSATWLSEKSRDAAWQWEEHLLTLIGKAPEQIWHNTRTWERSASLRTLGLWGVLIAALLYAGGMVFILLGVMHS